MYDLCVFTCIILIFVFRCTHVQMSYVLNSYLLTYLLNYQTNNEVNKALQNKRENVAIAMHCNLRPPDAESVLNHFNYDTHTKFEVTQPIHCHLISFYCWYVTLRCDLDLWFCDLDFWPLILNICSASPVTWWNSVSNLSEIEQPAAESLRFECLALWPWTCLTC